MGTHPPETPEQSIPDRTDTLGSVKERIERLEALQRAWDLEYRLLRLEDGVDTPKEATDEDNDGDETEGCRVEGEGDKAVKLALADLIKSGAVTQIIDLFKQSFEYKAKETETQRQVTWKAHVLGLLFGALIFAAVCALRWHDKITQELAAGLIGTLIGYWYGHDKGK
jgi:hypothetical protein